MADTKRKSGSKKSEKKLTASVIKSTGSRRTTSESPKKASESRASSSARPAKKADAAKNSAHARAAEAEARRKRRDRTDEIAGIVLIALGIVLGILTYAKTTAVFVSVVRFLFGLFGVVQYAMPAVLVALGIALIAVPRRQFGTGTTLMCLLSVLALNCVIHLFTVKPGDTPFKEYVNNAYTLGTFRSGGGAVASMPAYGLSKLISVGGAIVVFIAIALVLLLIVTKLSLRSAGRKVRAKVDAMEDRRKARIINERVGEESVGSRRRRPREPEPAEEPGLTGFDEPDTGLVLGGDGNSESLSGSFKGKRRRKDRMRVDSDDLDHVISSAQPAKEGEPSLEFLPKKGALPRKVDLYGDIDVPRIKNKRRPKPEEPETPVYAGGDEPYYDPFETIEYAPEDISGESAADNGGAAKPANVSEPEKPSAAAPGEVSADVIAEPQAIMAYQRPPLSLLTLPDRSEAIANDSPDEKAKLLVETLASFNINARVINIAVGPAITRFELQPAQGVRVNRITALQNDIALALAAPRVRMEAPIPGKAAVGIEIPNKDTAMVRLREVLDTREFSSASSPLTFALGKDIAGKPVYANLEKMPHMLIAGSTGSGKSVCINSIILSTIYKSSPDEVRMILIDPKVVELSIFAPVPHLYCPVVTDAKKAAGVLKWACNEMDQRYNKMSKLNARDITRYNSLQEDPENRMPRLMIIIDELADLMIVAAKDVEESIARLAQLGRASGIHLIVATQRPSVDVITGLIKANIPSRIAFAVSSAIDSRVILDAGGAEKLLGRGDMLFHPNGAAKPIRAQGAFVSDEEVESVMQFFVDHQIEVPQDMRVLDAIPDLSAPTGQGNGKQEDDLLPDAVRIVMESGSASISMIQRRLRVGYARAARLVDIMEQMKLVSGFDGSKPRKVLIDEAGYQELFGSGGISE